MHGRLRCLTKQSYQQFLKAIGPKEENVLDKLIGEAESKPAEGMSGLMRRPIRPDGTLDEATSGADEPEHIKWARQIRNARLARKAARNKES